MASIASSIDVSVPVTRAFERWSNVFSFPRFMTGVRAVHYEERSFACTIGIGPLSREYRATIVESVDDEFISWSSSEGGRSTGQVRFQALAPDQAKVTVLIAWRPDGLLENAASAARFDQRQVAADLRRFKALVESEEGEWQLQENSRLRDW